MKSRYRLSNGIVFAEFERSSAGLTQAKLFRAANPEFKGRHIKDIIQAIPASIPLAVILTHT